MIRNPLLPAAAALMLAACSQGDGAADAVVPDGLGTFTRAVGDP